MERRVPPGRAADGAPTSPLPGGQGGRPPAAGLPLDPVGPYRLIEILGEGGAGTVFRAEQTAPIRRQVALKLIRRGLDTDRIVARFESERQAIARMDHPSIARVLDAGASADGRPYFVMELVAGMPITRFCDRERLTIRERIELVVAVCRAVQHAHQKGIIHRDLKPSNVLATRQDGAPVPKVIDFGIAKAIEEPLTDGTRLTRHGQFIGTPDYMSPEQAGVLDADVDTRTDVYALGVLLYELLVGCRPFRFEGRTQDHLLRALGRHDPDRPSTVASGRRRPRTRTPLDAAARARVADARRTTPERLGRQVSGDLDTIVLMAMQKEPSRRYGSVEQLAEDLQRYLAGLPIAARPDTWTYRTGKFVRRHTVAVGAAGAALLVLVAFAVTMAVQSARVAAERDRAMAAEQRALAEAETAQQVSDFLVELFQGSDPAHARGATVTAREMLDRGAARLETELADRPLVQARLLDTIGTVYIQLGLYDAAVPLLDRALALRERELGEVEEVAVSLDGRAWIDFMQGDWAAAVPRLERSLAIRERLLDSDHRLVAESLNNLAAVNRELGEHDRARALYQRAIAIMRRDTAAGETGVAFPISNLATVYHDQGRYAEAEPLHLEALEIRRGALGHDHPEVGMSLNDLGWFYSLTGDLTRAESYYDEALALLERVVGPDHPQTALTLNNLGLLRLAQGRLDEAEAYFQRALAIREQRLQPGHRNIGDSLHGLGTVAARRGQPDEARPLLERALTSARRREVRITPTPRRRVWRFGPSSGRS